MPPELRRIVERHRGEAEDEPTAGSAVSGTPANPPTASVSGKNSAESHQSPAEPVGAVALATNSTPVPAPGKPTNQPTVSPRALTLITVGRTVGTTRRNRRRSRTHLTVRRAVLPMTVCATKLMTPLGCLGLRPPTGKCRTCGG